MKFINGINSTLAGKNFVTNRNYISYIDDTWSTDSKDLNNYGPLNNKGYRLFPVIIFRSSVLELTDSLKKTCQSCKDFF